MEPQDGRPDFSDAKTSSDYYSDGSDEGQSYSAQEFREQYQAFARETTFTPQPAVGFGESTYGLDPDKIVVANTGPAKGLRAAYRQDLQPLYRWDSRDYTVIFKEGFRPHNDKRPSSMQHYQAETIETALVSTTRDARWDADEGPRPAWSASAEGYSYRYTINAPGGYDFLASLNVKSYARQQEVAFWKGIRPEYISEVAIFDQNGVERARYSNPNAHAARETEARRIAAERAAAVSPHASTRPGVTAQQPTWQTASPGPSTASTANPSGYGYAQPSYAAANTLPPGYGNMGANVAVASYAMPPGYGNAQPSYAAANTLPPGSPQNYQSPSVSPQNPSHHQAKGKGRRR